MSIIHSITFGENDRDAYLGSKCRYTEPKEIISIPANYNTEFIVFLARHGSRYPSCRKRHLKLFNILNTADICNCLTPEGKRLLSLVNDYFGKNQSKFGAINRLGRQEHYALGKRLTQTYPAFFEDSRAIVAYSTYKKRTQSSRKSFIDGVNSSTPHIVWSTREFKKGSDPILRFLDSSTNYSHYMKHRPGSQLRSMTMASKTFHGITGNINQTFFSGPFLPCYLAMGRFDIDDPAINVSSAELVMLIHNYIVFDERYYKTIRVNTPLPFNDKEQVFIGSINETQKFYKQGPGFPGIVASYESAATFAYFLNNAIRKSIYQKKQHDAMMFFGHLYTILPIISFLNINDLNQPALILKPENWPVHRISPMAANLSWVILSKNHDYFIQLRLNEKPAIIPALVPVANTIYRLDEYLLHIDQQLGATIFDFNKVNATGFVPLIDELVDLLSSSS